MNKWNWTAFLKKASGQYIVPLIILMVCMLGGSVSAQQAAANKTVSGQVKDEAGEPIPGVIVTIKNTQLKVSTNSEGRYSISVPANATTLVFSFIGLSTVELAIKGTEPVNAVMTEESSALNELVVVGYGTQKKADLTASVSTIKAEDLVRTPSAAVGAALVGKVQGITTRTGRQEPGSGTSLQIRNMGTPLFVVDGVPVNSASFNQLSNEDIENISILKDGAAAIYGLQASNGVVLVTTKKGKLNSKPTIGVSTYYGLQGFTRFPHPANVYQYVRAVNESNQNLGQPLTYSKEELEKYRLGETEPYQSFDYYDAIISKAVPQYSVNVSASGGSQTSTYRVSISNISQKGIIQDYNFGRTNLSANLNVGLAKGLKFGVDIQGRKENRRQPGTQLNNFDFPFIAVFRMIPFERPYANNNPNYINGAVRNIATNPATFKESVLGYRNQDDYNLRSVMNLEYSFSFGLVAKALYSYSYGTNNTDTYNYAFDSYLYDAATDTYTPKTAIGQGARTSNKSYGIDQDAQIQLNYAKKIGDHSISATSVYEWIKNDSQNTNISAIPPTNYSEIINLADITAQTYGVSEGIDARFAGRLDYSYKSKYLLQFAGSYNGSWQYPPGKRWGFFPSISAGWVISQEPFVKDNLSFLSNLKLRASYGQSGQVNGISAFGFLGGATFGSGNSVFGTSLVTGTVPRNPPTTNITWVTSTNKNIGLDIGLFRNKLTAEFDVFERELTGIPAARTDVLVPQEIGYGLPNENLNSDATQGVEGILTYNGKAGKVNYSITGNATLARGKNGFRYNARFGNSYDQYLNQQTGRWADFASTRGYIIIGRFQSQAEIDAYPVDIDGRGNRDVLPGDFIYKDVNGDGVINGSDDDQAIGYSQGAGANPLLSFGGGGSVDYKGFSLNFDFSGGTMFSFRRDFEAKVPFQGNGNSPDFMFEDRWHREDVFDPNSKWIPGTYPAIRAGNTNVVYTRSSSFWIENMTYIRLRNLELGYNIPKKVISKVGFDRIRVYANVSNLFSIDKAGKYGLDPETNTNSGLAYPQQKLWNFGLNLTL